MTDLIERLSTAEKGSRELSDEVLEAFGWTDRFPGMAPPNAEPDDEGLNDWGRPSPTESVDDVLALVPEGWTRDLCACPETGVVARIYSGPVRTDSAGEPTGFARTLPLAVCIAILRAREAGRAALKEASGAE